VQFRIESSEGQRVDEWSAPVRLDGGIRGAKRTDGSANGGGGSNNGRGGDRDRNRNGRPVKCDRGDRGGGGDRRRNDDRRGKRK
jgi:hypothetical protein